MLDFCKYGIFGGVNHFDHLFVSPGGQPEDLTGTYSREDFTCTSLG